MVENSENTTSCLGLRIDFELRLSIDECPFRIRPDRTARYTMVHWECGLCGQGQALSAHPDISTESLLFYGKNKTWDHMVREHPGPNSRAFFQSI